MTIHIQENKDLQTARRTILVAHVLLALTTLGAFFGLAAWLQKSGGHAERLSGFFTSPLMGVLLLCMLAVFVFQIAGYYKLAKVSRNLLIFRCIAFPYIADAILSLLALMLFPKASLDQMLHVKSITFLLYLYYSYRLFDELSRVTQDRAFKRGVLLIGGALGLLFLLANLGPALVANWGILLVVSMVVGWGMIFLGFVRLKQISTP
ncbi:hypothetical protein [Helicobacter bizzozeronii]|uniref:hypothetical protein n=1 Tax=Helicobacter bizzozeronii TaxID=56877 RepID=UPI000CEF3E97|nr:hypothetical protein [Helicobacter bizzozeronii]